MDNFPCLLDYPQQEVDRHLRNVWIDAYHSVEPRSLVGNHHSNMRSKYRDGRIGKLKSALVNVHIIKVDQPDRSPLKI